MNISRLFIAIICIAITGCTTENNYPQFNHDNKVQEYYQNDAGWYHDNIPFFECSDKQMEEVYYYRWKMYKAHIRSVGNDSFVITEFINHVSWDRDPYCTINAASMHHIYEGRWLKDDRYMNGYIDYLYQNGGNNRRYSESVADAAYARYLVNGDASFLIKQLDSMKAIYNAWADHWDSTKNMYYIEAMPDATEYTIAAIDGSGGKPSDLNGGEAFRPTINSYMYANALAISRIAALVNDNTTSDDYLQRADALKKNVQQYLWNDSLQHFTDRYKMNNQFVHYWNFIRGRELAGMIPWYFNLPPDSTKYAAAWKHVTHTNHLLGPFGFRTNEPAYEHYFEQYVYFEGQRGSQWNGPSWPYQSSQVLTGMANLLNDYSQSVVTTADYVKLLRLYTKQHYLPDGQINLVENYDPNLGGPIVYYYWSNHYNHSSFNNLIISGLCGVRPSAGDSLDINPLIDSSIHYFILDDLRYHGHAVTVVYDEDGSKYKVGKGLTVFVDGSKAELVHHKDKYRVFIGAPVTSIPAKRPANHALNITRKNYPVPSASVNTTPDTSMYQAIDGRIWYFPEITNRWTTLGSTAKTDWYALDFGSPKEMSTINIYLFADGKTYDAPESFTIDYFDGSDWKPARLRKTGPKPTGNTVNTVSFDRITTSRIRINFHHDKAVAVSEIECD